MFAAFCSREQIKNRELARILWWTLSTYLNISIVSSENLACSQADPTISISCRLSVMCGVLSQGGVVSGLNLEPEPLSVNTRGVTLFYNERRMARAFEYRWTPWCMTVWMSAFVCLCLCGLLWEWKDACSYWMGAWALQSWNCGTVKERDEHLWHKAVRLYSMIYISCGHQVLYSTRISNLQWIGKDRHWLVLFCTEQRTENEKFRWSRDRFLKR